MLLLDWTVYFAASELFHTFVEFLSVFFLSLTHLPVWHAYTGWGSGTKEEEKASSGSLQPAAAAAQPSQTAGRPTQASAVAKVCCYLYAASHA